MFTAGCDVYSGDPTSDTMSKNRPQKQVFTSKANIMIFMIMHKNYTHKKKREYPYMARHTKHNVTMAKIYERLLSSNIPQEQK